MQMRTIIGTACISLLTACGGGGGSSTPAVSAEGAWVGTSSSGYTLNTLVLENNDFWNMFGTMSGSTFLVRGFDQGSVSVSGSTYSGNLREYPNQASSYAGTITGTVVANTSMSGSTTYTSGTFTHSLTPFAQSTFNYNTPATLSSVQGTWVGTMSTGSSATTAITSGGVISGSNAGCLFTGTATPRPTGKNVFNVSVTFGAAPCALPGQTATGIAITYPIVNTALNQLIVAVQDSTKQYGIMFFAQR